jgi:N-acetyl-anhydromuramyl-L-alanine amidase AmpD
MWIGCLLLLAGGCARNKAASTHAPGQAVSRSGDEIVVCGQFFHTGAPVVLWIDPGGYDAYRVEKRFAPWPESSWDAAQKGPAPLASPNRYDVRRDGLSDEEFERVRGGGWDLPLLQKHVDQFVLHYDGMGTSRRCFLALQDQRDLSVHFLLDLDGTIYQTLDLKERAWHATISNSRSIGVEIANIGAYPVQGPDYLHPWYCTDASGKTSITIPAWAGESGIRTANFVARPINDKPVTGVIQGKLWRQYDLTPQQYDSLIKLTAALCRIFPLMRCDYPRDAAGKLIAKKLDEAQWAAFRGVLGHYHVQANKEDPGPALQWDRIIQGAQKLLSEK